MNNQEYILVIENSKMLTQIIKMEIQKYTTFGVDVASSLQEAQQQIDESGHSYFLAITSLVLADSTDGEIVDHIIQNNIAVIVFSSKFSKPFRKRMMSQPIIDYIIKDHDYNESIVSLIQRLHKNQFCPVLLVEDSKVVRWDVREQFHRLKFPVKEAECGIDALKIIEEHPDIKMIIVDYNMPGMNGLEFIKKIRQTHHRSKLAIIGISASSDKDLSAEFIKCGANDFLHIPYSREEFARRIHQNLDTLDQIAGLELLNQKKNHLLGIAAHDLRNPLGVVSTFSQILMEPSQNLTEDQYAIIGHMKGSCDFMLSLIEDLLDVSAIESGKLTLNMQETAIKPFLQNIVDLNNVVATNKSIAIEFDHPAPLPHALFDHGKIEQVINNLISNAIKFSHPKQPSSWM